MRSSRAAYGEFFRYVYDNLQAGDTRVVVGAVADVYNDDFTGAMFAAVGDQYDGFSFHCYEYFYGGLTNRCRAKFEDAQQLTGSRVDQYRTAGIVGDRHTVGQGL